MRVVGVSGTNQIASSDLKNSASSTTTRITCHRLVLLLFVFTTTTTTTTTTTFPWNLGTVTAASTGTVPTITTTATTNIRSIRASSVLLTDSSSCNNRNSCSNRSSRTMMMISMIHLPRNHPISNRRRHHDNNNNNNSNKNIDNDDDDDQPFATTTVTSRRCRRFQIDRSGHRRSQAQPQHAVAQLVSSMKSSTTTKKVPPRRGRQQPPVLQLQRPPEENELTVVGTILASTVEIVTSTVMNYCTGYVTGYVIGTMIGIPQSLIQRMNRPPTTAIVTQLQQSASSSPSLSSWIRRIHTKSHVNYGKKWGTVSSIFSGSRTFVTVLRRPRRRPTTTITNTAIANYQQHDTENEQWNDVLSSVLAGAFMARSEGPQAMIRNAVLFGSMSYLFASVAATPRAGKQQLSSSYDTPLIEF